jgi:hypothetical protein
VASGAQVPCVYMAVVVLLLSDHGTGKNRQRVGARDVAMDRGSVRKSMDQLLERTGACMDMDMDMHGAKRA